MLLSLVAISPGPRITTDSESNIGNSTTHNRVDDSFLTTTRKRPKILQQTGDKNNKNGYFK